MKKTILAVTAALACTAGAALASEGVHWGYSGEVGPANWGELDPSFEMCAKGVNQAPINLTDFVEAEMDPLTFTYTGLVTEILNNGHSIQANYAVGSTMTVAGKTFELKQFHFHSPSENQINGAYFPMEGHFVHADYDGNLAVISVMYTIGDENHGMEKLWKQMPAEEGNKAGLASQVRAEELMPADKDYYRFNGSLTTPPCSEGVVWIVMKNPVTVSEAQVKQFTEVMGHPNNRPIQSTNARPILQ
jgi:carbonic anhydrase